MKEFDAVRVKEECINWIRDWFEKNGKGCNAIVGISGGKDSSVVAALLCEALGIDRVIGVMMPNGVQPDIDDSKEVCAALGIKNYTINIHDMTSALLDVQFKEAGIEVTKQTMLSARAITAELPILATFQRIGLDILLDTVMQQVTFHHLQD